MERAVAFSDRIELFLSFSAGTAGVGAGAGAGVGAGVGAAFAVVVDAFGTADEGAALFAGGAFLVGADPLVVRTGLDSVHPILKRNDFFFSA